MISALLEPRAASGPPPDDDFWYGNLGDRAQTGVSVTPDVALRYSAFWACIKVISEDVGSLPLLMYERIDERSRRRAPSHPLFDLFRFAPNERQTAFEFKEMQTGFLLSRGNAYSEIIPGPRGFADQLVPLRPDRITVSVNERSGALVYDHALEDGTTRRLREDQVWHLRGLSTDGYTGLSVVGLARESVGLGLAQEGYTARFYANDATPGGALKHPKKLGDKAFKRLRESWAMRHEGFQNRGRPAIFEEGMDWVSIGMTHEDAQHIESKKLTLRDVCRWFRMPPHKIADLDDATFSNIEHQAIEYVVDTLRPWLVRWEQRIAHDLILAPRRFFAEFLIDALLRGDIKTRYEAYEIGIRSEFLSPNEARERENLNPREDGGGDEFRNPNTKPSNGPIPPSSERALYLARVLLEDVAARTVRRECRSIANAAKRYDDQGFAGWFERFASEHAAFLVSALRISETQARAIAHESREEAVAAYHAKTLPALLDRWALAKPQALADAAWKNGESRAA